MSHFDITDIQGNRYRVREGWHYPPFLPQTFAGDDVDLQLLLRFDESAIEQIYDRFLRFEQQLPDPSAPRERHRFEGAFQFDPYASAPAFLSEPGKEIYLALAEQRLIIEENPPGEDELAERQALLLQKIRMGLRQIIAQERVEAAHHAQMLAGESRTSRALIYTGAFFSGLWDAGVDLAKWAKEVNDVINPTQRLLRSMHASHRALQRSRENGKNILTAYADEHLKGEKRELVQALGFDPTAITAEQLEQAMEVADLVWDNATLRADITLFARDYVKAQHAIELTNLSGAAAFEVLFTIILAAATAGAGLAVGAASQARHLAKFRKVGDLLMEFAEHTRKIRLKRSAATQSRPPSRSINDLPSDEVTVKSNVAVPSSNPATKRKQPLNKRPEQEIAKVSPEKVDWSESGPNGLEVHDPREIPIGKEIFDSLLEKDLEPDLALRISRELLESGVAEPEKIVMKKGEELYKVMPKGGNPPGDNSPYFMTREMLDALPSDAGEAGDILGLPQVADSFDIYKITATKDVTVYQSKIAEFSVNGGEFIRSGGGTQTLVINRGSFSTPMKL